MPGSSYDPSSRCFVPDDAQSANGDGLESELMTDLKQKDIQIDPTKKNNANNPHQQTKLQLDDDTGSRCIDYIVGLERA